MCKNLFNKNQNYTIKELGEALMQALPGKWSDMHSCATNISRYIKEKDIKPVNSQKSHRVFSGIDCQAVYEHYAPSMDKRQVKMKLPEGKTSNPLVEEEPVGVSGTKVPIITFLMSGVQSLKPSDLRKLKERVDELVLSSAPDWEKLQPGDKFEYRGHEWVCLDPNFAAVGGTGCLAIMAKLYRDEFAFCRDENKDNMNEYGTSDIRDLLSELATELQNGECNVFLNHNVDAVMENGEEAYKAFETPMFILSIQEYIRYAKFVPQYDNWFWLRSPIPSYADHVRIVYTDGSLYYGHAYNTNIGVAPACIFNRHI